MVRKGWQSMDVPSGWIQVLRGPRPKSVQWPLAKDRVQPAQVGVSGRWRQPQSAKGAPPVGPRPRMNPDIAREMAHTKVSRLEKALEAMGDLQGPVVEALKADLEKAKAASKKPSVEVEIDECRKFISSGGEAHQRAGHGAGQGTSFSGRSSGASRETGGRAIQVPRDPRHAPWDTSDCTPANGQFVAVRARCFGEGVDSSQVSCLGGSDHSPCCEETSGLTASIVASRRTWSDPVDALPRAKRCYELVGGSTTRFPRGIDARRCEKSSRIVQDVVRRSPPFGGVVSTPTIICGQHGDVNAEGDHCLHRCGCLGCRVGEASNPGPVQTRQARRAEHDQVIGDTAQDSVSTTRRRRRRLRPLPWSWDSDTEPDGPVHAPQARRSCPCTQVDTSSSEEHSNHGRRVVPRTDAELPSTVPASPGALVAGGLWPEHKFPTSDTQHDRRLVFRRRTVGEPESTVPATQLVLAVGGMAVDDVPVTVLDALEEVF